MRNIFSIALLFVTQLTFGQQQPLRYSRIDILENIFWFSADTGACTLFVIENNHHEFLITAGHCFKRKDYKDTSVKFWLNVNFTWTQFEGKLFRSNDTLIDIAIIKLKENIQRMTPVPLSPAHFMGDECRFFGFPYNGFFSRSDKGYLPFMKKAIVSTVGDKIVYLDGMNNPGFSGGPVVMWDAYDNRLKILGVISSYHPQVDSTVGPNNSIIHYKENSGIIYCYPIKDVQNMLDSLSR